MLVAAHPKCGFWHPPKLESRLNSSKLRLKKPGARQAEVGRILAWELVQCARGAMAALSLDLGEAHTTQCNYDAAVVSPVASRIGLTCQKSGDICICICMYSASATLIAGRYFCVRFNQSRIHQSIHASSPPPASPNTIRQVVSPATNFFVSRWHCRKPPGLEVFETAPPTLCNRCHPRRENWEKSRRRNWQMAHP